MVQPVTFLGSDAPAATVPGARSATRERRLVLVTGAAWLLSAALCALAALSDVFTFHYLDAFSARGGYDATGNPLQSGLPGDRGPRWSIALWLLALAFVVLGTLTMRAAALGSIGSAVRTLGVVSWAVLVGIAIGIALFIEASLSTSDAVAKLYQEHVDLHISACVWLVLAAVVCALGAVLLSSGLSRPALRRPDWSRRTLARRTQGVPLVTPEDGDPGEMLPSGRRAHRAENAASPVPPQVFDL